jgi:hypothetical protein
MSFIPNLLQSVDFLYDSLRVFHDPGVIISMNGRPNDRHIRKVNNMKNWRNILVIAAVVTIAPVAMNAEALYSPKGMDNAKAFRRSATSSTDVNLAAARPNGNAKAWETAQSLNKVGAGNQVDFAHAARPALGAKNPGYEAAWRENAQREVQIAPAK